MTIFKAKNTDKILCNLNVGKFVVSTNVVNMPHGSLVQDGLEGTCDIFHEEEVTSVASIPMKCQGHASQNLIGELGDKLFRILVRSIDVVSTGNNDGKLEGPVIGFDNEFCSGLGGSVGVSGLQYVFFLHGVHVEVCSFPIHFIGGDVNESTDGLAIFGRFQENVRTVNVGVGEGKRVTEGVIYVSLRSKVHDSVNLFLLEHIVDEVRTANVSLYEFKVGVPFQVGNVGVTGAVVELIVHDNLVLRVFLEKEDCDMGSNETCWHIEPKSDMNRNTSGVSLAKIIVTSMIRQEARVP